MKKEIATLTIVILLIINILSPIFTYAEEHYSSNSPTVSDSSMLGESDVLQNHEHTLIESEIIEPTCTQSGKITYACESSYCDYEKTETLNPTGHKYKNRVIAKANVNTDGKLKTTCEKCGDSYETVIPKIETIALNKYEFNYIGYIIKPVVIIKDSAGKDIPKLYYGVSYTNNKRVGTATVTINFFGRYSGKKSLNFEIKNNSTAKTKANNVSLVDTIKTAFSSIFKPSTVNEPAVYDHIYGTTTEAAYNIRPNSTNTNFGYGVRVKNPRSAITKIFMNTLVTEESNLLCTVVSADMTREYYCARATVTPENTECCFKFSNSFVIEDETEIYILVTSDKNSLCEGMTTEKSPNTLNSEIGAANAKVSKGGNVYSDDGKTWKYRSSVRTDEKNIYALSMYIFCKNDYYNIVNNTIYVSPDGSDETGNGSKENPYASVYYANQTITDSGYFNRYTIKVEDGEYDDMSTRPENSKTRSIICKNYVTYEGNTEHPENCVIYYDGSKRDYGEECTYSKVKTKAIFEISSSSRTGRLGINTSIKGFKLVGRNLRYALHFDTAGGGIGGSWDIGNLIINYQGNPECVGDNAYHYAIGCGMAQFENALYHDIVFEGNQKTYSGTDYNYIYYGHNNAHNQSVIMGGLVPGNVEFRDCDLNKGRIIVVSLNDNTVNFTVVNCINKGTVNDSEKVRIKVLKNTYSLYSSVYKASLDANRLITDNADVIISNEKEAVCALYIQNGKAEIKILKNATESNSSFFTVDALIDIQQHELAFADGEFLSFSNNAEIKNGTLITSNSLYTINATGTHSKLTLIDILLSHGVKENSAEDTVAINSACEENNIEGVSINLTQKGNSQYRVIGFDAANSNSKNNFNNVSVVSDVNGARVVIGSRFKGESSIENYSAIIKSSTSGAAGGIQFKASQETHLKNANINVYSANSDSWGINEASREFHGEGLQISATSGDYNNRGTALVLSTSQKCDIVSSQNNPINAFGSFASFETSGNGLFTINGGDYSAEVHPAYIAANTNISNAKIFTDKKHETGENWGIYFGGASASEKIINMTNVTIGSEDITKNIYPFSLTTSSRDNQKTPKQVNLYGCTVYSGIQSFFNFNYPTSVNKSETSFNLYDNTKLIKNDGIILSKDAFTQALSSWLCTARYSNALRKYNGTIGNDCVWGTQAANVDETTGEIKDVFLNNNAGVFDYR